MGYFESAIYYAFRLPVRRLRTGPNIRAEGLTLAVRSKTTGDAEALPKL